MPSLYELSSQVLLNASHGADCIPEAEAAGLETTIVTSTAARLYLLLCKFGLASECRKRTHHINHVAHRRCHRDAVRHKIAMLATRTRERPAATSAGHTTGGIVYDARGAARHACATLHMAPAVRAHLL